METDYLFDFLTKMNDAAANIGKEVELLIYDDPKGAVIRARLFSEEIIKDILTKETQGTIQPLTHYDRIVYLHSTGILENKIKQVLDIIRMNGNKAAHDSTYQVDILGAIKIFKNMYELSRWYAEVYSHNVVVPEYRDPKFPKRDIALDDVQQLIDKTLQGKLKQYMQLKNDPDDDEIKNIQPPEELNKDLASDEFEEFSLINKNLPEGRSYLLRELKRLQESSQEAIENANTFSQFKEYMHVDREIQQDCIDIMKIALETNRSQLILLSGSVGDGKSHLLAYLNEKHHDIMRNFRIVNDATESLSPNKDAIETLSELLDGFSDEKINSSNEKIILAINLGVLHNFLSHSHGGKTFNALKKFVEDSGLFSEKVITKNSDGTFHLIGFSDYHPFQLSENGPCSSFYTEIIKKVFMKSKENPFYQAYLIDHSKNIRGIIHENFEFLMDENVQNEIVQLVIQCIISDKLVISARAFYNLIADLIIPETYSELSDFEWNEYEKLHQTTPYLLFNRSDRSFVLKAMSKLDPVHVRSNRIDQIIVDLNTLSAWTNTINECTNNEIALSWIEPFTGIHDEATEYNTYEITQALIRITYLTNKEFADNVKSDTYKDYMYYLYAFNTLKQDAVIKFYKEFFQMIYKWLGSPKADFVYVNNKANERYRIAQKLSVKPNIDHLTPCNDELLTSFKQQITVAFQAEEDNQIIQMEIDYPLYELLKNVAKGYCPNKKDEEDGIKFVEFLDQLLKLSGKKDEMLIHIPMENKLYALREGFFGDYVFEKENV